MREVGKSVRERLAVDELENQESDAVCLFKPVDRADVGVIQRGQHSGLALEAREPVRVSRERARQDLDGDVAPERGVVRYLAAPAAPVNMAAARNQTSFNLALSGASVLDNGISAIGVAGDFVAFALFNDGLPYIVEQVAVDRWLAITGAAEVTVGASGLSMA